MEFKCEQCNLHGDLIADISYKMPLDVDIHEVMNGFRNFLLAVGYTSSTVAKYIPEE